MRLNVYRSAPLEIHVGVGAIFVFIQGRVSSANTRQVIAKHRDVYRVAPKAVALIVVTVVAFQQLHVRCRIMPGVQSGFR